MRGKVRRVVKDPVLIVPTPHPYEDPNTRSYMFTVLVTSTDWDKARETAQNYLDDVQTAWALRNPEVMADTILETTKVEMM